MELFDGQGQRIALGKELGRGGEGTVFEVPAIGAEIVAKVYHEALSQDKQAKLRTMVARVDDKLKAVAAWPLQTLHPKAGGPIRGFLMPKAQFAEPLHHLYGPGHRKQRFPNADWAFLVHTARNVAAAFTTVHGSGCVIGDINPNSVFVGRNSLARLIDCDSFQIPNGNSPFLCEVGVPNFTAPELQGRSSFRDVLRTANHDNFGLALLVFHLLLMGRHPYSGRYTGNGDMPQERAIQEFRYAFTAPAGSRGLLPPPNTVGPEILPPAMAAMFEQAFTEVGAKSGRPTAANWVAALDGVKSQLRACTADSSHKYYGGHAGCPWCEIEQRANIIFFVGLVTTPGANASTFDLSRVWAAILAVQTPGTASTPAVVATTGLVPKPLPPEVREARTWQIIRRVAAVLIFLGCVAVSRSMAFLSLFLCGWLFLWKSDVGPELNRRKDTLRTAKQVAAAAWAQWTELATDKAFQDKIDLLKKARHEYEELSNKFAADKVQLQKNARELQLRRFLEQFFISDYDIPGVGPTRKSTLASFGIETAADVSYHQVRAIKGFGERLTGELMNWRKRIESRFVFDPSKGIDPAELGRLQQRYTQLKRQLESQLTAGPELLKRERQRIEQERNLMREVVSNANLQVAQAEADYRAIA
ncbi:MULTISPECIES: helix-hairpin-helix domain-containing protein [Ralstonia solanacearum species complex]|uniref:helix-hairpin-helix domain-containing protein n=1 Tax=Ralstonia solanacearum species complex TaxID=3116862 RepID=UPI000E5911C8|nr:helix-hairpin-helix domain-containing protein [Ralstonia solanacearum]BEU73444.1 protein kinase YegI [Ralstonia pseudosolanacearum]AXV78231.1 hypothetical protein CJO76_15330 [Ralstonia solanacearum]AXV92254.1 hypothetical protein CJO79_15310 [Ralstonia solanacearum]AXW20326.1 hypothetical protein CJO85_15360 [Ralstonia solanacearum]AXW77143.1 hypothetical protein CJO97_15305 [Ralstonia solanacearum]